MQEVYTMDCRLYTIISVQSNYKEGDGPSSWEDLGMASDSGLKRNWSWIHKDEQASWADGAKVENGKWRT